MDWPFQLDLRQTSGLIYLLAVVLCAIGAAMHVRRRDPRFFIADCDTVGFFPTILTQMAAHYTILPAVIAASLIGVSTGHVPDGAVDDDAGMYHARKPIRQHRKLRGAPVTGNMTQPTFPGLAWAMLLAAAIFLYCAVAPRGAQNSGKSSCEFFPGS